MADLKIGDVWHGGYIYHIDGTTIYIIAEDDYSSTWGCEGTRLNIYGEDAYIGMGEQNTLEILTGCTTRPIASSICDSLSLSGYTDWYLPSLYELYLLFDKAVYVYKESPIAYNSNIFNLVKDVPYLSSNELEANPTDQANGIILSLNDSPFLGGTVINKNDTELFRPVRKEIYWDEYQRAVIRDNNNKITLNNNKELQLWDLGIGDDFQGGKIVYIDYKGSTLLIAGLEDINEAGGYITNEYNGVNNYSMTNASGITIGDGYYNTMLASYAYSGLTYGVGRKPSCYIATSYSGYGYTDWFVPSINELQAVMKCELYYGGLNISKIGSGGGYFYWSSTEYYRSGTNFPTMCVCRYDSKDSYLGSRSLLTSEQSIKLRPVRMVYL